MINLVTQLKGSAQGSDFPKNGEGTIVVNGIFAVTGNVYIRAGENVLATQEGGPYTDSIYVNSSSEPVVIYCKKETRIFVSNWYDTSPVGITQLWGGNESNRIRMTLTYNQSIRRLNEDAYLADIGVLPSGIVLFTSNVEDFNLDNESYPSLTSFGPIAGGEISCSYPIADFVAKVPNIQILRLDSLGDTPIVYGSLDEIGKLTSLIDFRGRQLSSGSMEGVAQNARAVGRTEGYIVFRNLSDGITFNGEPVNVGLSAKELSWTASTITFDDVTIEA